MVLRTYRARLVDAMKVLVCGGRGYNNDLRITEVLDEIDGEKCIDLVMHGGASGADSLTTLWAQRRGRRVIVYPAKWEEGRSAGPIRNQFMLDDGKPDLVVAFPGGRGTADMVARSKKAAVEVREVK